MKCYENYYFYSLTWKFTPCKMTIYMKLMTASCSMSNFLPIVIIFRQITYSVFPIIIEFTIYQLKYNLYIFYIYTHMSSSVLIY